MVIGKGSTTHFLSESDVRDLAQEALAQADLQGQRVLVIIPDHTRTAPIPLFFRLFHELLWGRVAALDYLVALGTHQPLSEEALHRLVGITAEEHRQRYAGVRIFNHRWDLPETFTTIGIITEDELHSMFHVPRSTFDINNLEPGTWNLERVEVAINKLIFAYDQLIICGPTFPHEVVGFSGGNKYFFPGIGGQAVIDFTHWLGAVITSMEIIGTKHTPVRQVIDRAASFISVPKLCFALVVVPANRQIGKSETELAGLYVGTPEEAWEAAADLSARLHIIWVDRPFKRVLSVMPEMYDDLWTAAKGMYKLEPAIADGGEVVIYAPHITEVSYTHGQIIDQVGYHVRDYFLKQWERFKDYPWCVLAHSTHLRGVGTYDAETGIEEPRIRVTLATGIPEERCRRIGLGYLDPASVDPAEWAGREDEGILVVPKAGEMLYRISESGGNKSAKRQIGKGVSNLYR
ncbi:MAG: lactate racemase domain-containing protein [Anaerolineae bacterium]|jgi:nickel-dependent lactate racemase|nr:lactate racemase domain-containing protein [Anaerolineae bacterium]MDH7473007.1 lactate racemase domain-containing protein [Anaerolineae bacterium]